MGQSTRLISCLLYFCLLQPFVLGAAPSAAVIGAGVNGLLAAIELKHRG